MNPNLPQLPPWSEIESNCRTNGMPAYLSALQTVYDAVSALMTTAPSRSSAANPPAPSAGTSGPYCVVTIEEYAQFVRDQNSLALLLSGEAG